MASTSNPRSTTTRCRRAWRCRLAALLLSLSPAVAPPAAPAADGGLEPLPGTPADDVPWGMAVSADGRFLAVTNFGSKTLTVYRIGADGGLERMTSVDVEDRIMDVVVR